MHTTRTAWMAFGLLMTAACTPLLGAGTAIADGDPSQVLWQIGTFDTGTADQRALEYPNDNSYTHTFDHAASGVDATPAFPGHLRDNGLGNTKATARVLHITFATACAYEEATLRYDRAGSERNAIVLDGTGLGTVSVQEGVSASFTFDVGPLPAGDHVLTITYTGGGADNGHFIDAIQMTVSERCDANIDIKPGSDLNPVNPRSNGKVPVAILSTPHMDAVADVDQATLTFGRTGEEASLSHCGEGEDVDGDGLLDLVCHFRTRDAGFQQGDTEGVLRGVLADGTAFEGRDTVTVV